MTLTEARTVRHEHDGTHRTFDYASKLYPANRDFFVRNRLPATAGAMDMPRWWTGGPVLDQGPDGTCVGHGVTGECLASPVRGRLPGNPKGDAARQQAGHELALEVFDYAANHDEFPGNSRADGTSVHAGWLAGRARGWYSGATWARDVEELRQGLEYGPIIIGVEWREGMFTTDRFGRVSATGAVAGGHCVCVTGYTPTFDAGRERRFRCRNSWGRSWGAGGNFYITDTDLQLILFDAQGEACVVTGRALGT